MNQTIPIQKKSDYDIKISNSVAELLLKLHQAKITDIINQTEDINVIYKMTELLKKYFKLHLNSSLI